MAFVLANVFIDLEVLFYLFGRRPFHRHCHTLLFATGLGVAAGLLTFLLSLRFARTVPAWWRASRMWIPVRGPRLFWICLLSGVVGGVSHLLLDSIMHPEILPFWPLSNSGGLLGVVRRSTLHRGCVAAGLLGMAIWLALELRRPLDNQQGLPSQGDSPGSGASDKEED